MMLVIRTDAGHPIYFDLKSSVDHVAPVTGATPAVTVSKNGGALAAIAGSVAEIGSGIYKITPDPTDVNANGEVAFHATATGADPVTIYRQVVAFSPYDGVRLGLSAFPAVPSGTSASLPTLDQIWDRPNILNPNLSEETMLALAAASFEIEDSFASAGTGGAVTLGSGAVAVDDFYTGRTLMVIFGPALGQARLITAYNGATKVATLDAPFTVDPTLTGAYAIISTAGRRLINLDAPVSVGSLDLPNGVETGLTQRQALRLLSAALAGKLSGAGTTTITIRNAVADSKPRITATVDGNGDRSAVTTDVS